MYLTRLFVVFPIYRVDALFIDSVIAYLPQGESVANRIFYLSVPHEALLDVASSLADHAQTRKGWNRIIIEKPFGFDALSSHQLTRSLLSKFEEKQIYRLMHITYTLFMQVYLHIFHSLFNFISG